MTQRTASEIVAMMRGRGMRITSQRRAILERILASRGHFTPQDIVRDLEERVSGVDPSTVYRTLAVLEDIGVVRHAHFEQGTEYHLGEAEEHVHLVCGVCGADDELSLSEAERLKKLVDSHHGFLPDLTHFAITGICSPCRRKGKTLSDLHPHD